MNEKEEINVFFPNTVESTIVELKQYWNQKKRDNKETIITLEITVVYFCITKKKSWKENQVKPVLSKKWCTCLSNLQINL